MKLECSLNERGEWLVSVNGHRYVIGYVADRRARAGGGGGGGLGWQQTHSAGVIPGVRTDVRGQILFAHETLPPVASVDWTPATPASDRRFFLDYCSPAWSVPGGRVAHIHGVYLRCEWADRRVSNYLLGLTADGYLFRCPNCSPLAGFDVDQQGRIKVYRVFEPAASGT